MMADRDLFVETAASKPQQSQRPHLGLSFIELLYLIMPPMLYQGLYMGGWRWWSDAKGEDEGPSLGNLDLGI